ncbi:MAG: hypothetical protein HY481_02235 [Candidatus Vogelbacteria bacterium]|nr:hypothetical protein [Candidatus Vogelbacteria bacterium]
MNGLCRIWPWGFKEGDLAYYRDRSVMVLPFIPGILGRGVVPVMYLAPPREVVLVPADDLDRMD